MRKEKGWQGEERKRGCGEEEKGWRGEMSGEGKRCGE